MPFSIFNRSQTANNQVELTRAPLPLPAALVSRVTREAGELGSMKFAKIKLRFNGPDPILWL